jgi:glycine betaine/proline transport system substrate-binding protein
MPVWLRHFTGVLTLLILILAPACVEQEKPTIRLADTQWESLWINNAIATFLIKEGYGYPVESERMTSDIFQEWLPAGLVDIHLEGWEHNSIGWYTDQIGRGNIENLGPIYEGGPQFFIVPAWLHRQHGINTVFDMAQRWEIFRDPDDPTKGAFINCIVAWKCSEINAVKLEAYGLAPYYNLKTPGRPEDLEDWLAGAQRRNQPVFGYYWAPSALLGRYDWYVLEEPSYSDACWSRVTLAAEHKIARPIQDACAYQTVPINKLVWSGLRDKAPEVYELLRKMNVGVEPIQETLAWMKENQIQDYSQAAVYYLRSFEDRWTTWMPAEKARRVKNALGAR